MRMCRESRTLRRMVTRSNSHVLAKRFVSMYGRIFCATLNLVKITKFVDKDNRPLLFLPLFEQKT